MHILVAPMLISEIRGKKKPIFTWRCLPLLTMALQKAPKSTKKRGSHTVSQYLLSQFLFSILSSKRPRSSPGVFTGYKIFMQTWQRLMWLRYCSPFRVRESGLCVNCLSCCTVVSQKLCLVLKKKQVPRTPLHSIKGVVRKSSKHEPGETSDWPPPSLPAAVCWSEERHTVTWSYNNTSPE